MFFEISEVDQIMHSLGREKKELTFIVCKLCVRLPIENLLKSSHSVLSTKLRSMHFLNSHFLNKETSNKKMNDMNLFPAYSLIHPFTH